MLTLEEYHKLQAAAFILHDKGLLQISPPSLVCCLTFLKSGQTSFELRSMAEHLNWSVERTRRSVQELASRQWEGLPLIEEVTNRHRPQGRFTPTCYQVVFRPTPECSQAVTPTDQSSLAENYYPKTISPSRSEPSRLNQCCLNKDKNKNNNQQTTQGGVGGDLVDKLKKVGVSDNAISEILEKYPSEIIHNQLSYLPYRQAKNPAGLLVQAIKDDWSAPKEYLAVKEEQQQAWEQTRLKEAEQQKTACEAMQKEMRQKQLLALETKLSVPEKNALIQEAERIVRQRLGQSWPKEKPIPQTFLKSEFESLLALKYLKHS